MDGEPGVYLLMRTVVADVREPYIFGVNPRGALQSFKKREMCGVLSFAQAVDDKVFRALDELYRFVGDFAAVGQVGEG